MSRKLPDDQKKKYTPLNLPVELVEELKDWRNAITICTGQEITWEELIRKMLGFYVRNQRRYHSDIAYKAGELKWERIQKNAKR